MNYLTSPAPNGQPITFCYSGVGIDLTAKENGYREFAANGQKYVVLDTTLLRAMIADEKLIKKYQKILPELGVEFCDAHSFYNELDDMCCPDEAIRPRMLERHKIAMDISAAFGVDTITIHMGRFTDHSISPRTHIDYAMKSLEELLPVAEKLGMVICIENVWYQTSAASTLLEAIERFRERTGYYPERVLADQIYRTRENRNFCKERGIRLSGPKLGRPSSNAKVDKKQEYQDNTDRIEVERTFSLSKRCYGMDCIATKLEETQLTSIALSVFVTNLFKIQKRILCALLYLLRIWSGYKQWNLQISA